MGNPKQYNNNKSALLRPSPQKLLIGIAFVTLFLLSIYKTAAIVNTDWNEGFHHPLQGWDHLLTMITVGIWAAQLRGHAIWILPLAFVGVMSLGSLAGAAGLAIPSVEGLILLSCAVFSILIVRRARFSTQVNVMIVAFFAFFHGFAHGQEISTSASLISYTLGFMLATLLLHGAGIIVAKLAVLSATCLVAVFFSSLAQANYNESVATSKNRNIPLVQDIGFAQISPLMVKGQLGYGEACHSLVGYRLCPDDISKNSIDENSDPNLPSKACKILGTIGKSSSYPLCANSKITGNIFGLGLKLATFHAQVKFQPALPIYYPDFLLAGSFDFKQHYPDINHTPGKDLLSNGVGLTSPPAFFVNLFVLHNPLPFRHTPTPSFEEFDFQMTFANFPPGKPSSIKATITPGNDYANRNPCDGKEDSLACKHRKKNIPAYLTPTNPFNPLSGLVVGAIPGLDLLSTQKIIKAQSRDTATIFKTTYPTNH